MEELINSLLVVLADATGKERSELESALIDSKDGQIKPKMTGEAVKSYLQPLMSSKFDQLATVSNSKADQIRGKAIKDTYTEIEKTIKDKYGLDGKFSDGLIDQLIDNAKASVKNNPTDVKNSEVYINTVKEYEDKLRQAKDSVREVESKWNRKFIESELIRHSTNLFKDPKAKTQIPADEEIYQNRIKKLINDQLNDPDQKVMLQDGKLRLTGPNGEDLYDDNHNVITLDSAIIKRGHSTYFEPLKQTPRTSPQAPMGDPNSQFGNPNVSRKIDLGEGKEYTLPEWKDKKDYNNWIIQAQVDRVDYKVIEQAEKVAETQFSES